MNNGSAVQNPAATQTVEAGENGNIVVLSKNAKYAAPDGLFQLPRLETGTEIFEVTIPEGYQLSLIDLSIPEATQLANAEIINRPAQGATGTFSVRIDWSHPVPLGTLTFNLKVYASPDGTPPPITVSLTEPGVNTRMRALFEQDSPVDLAIEGTLVQVFYDQIVARGGDIDPLPTTDTDGGLSAGTIAITITVIAAVCIAIGLATFAAVLIFAIAKGYNIDNAGYKVAVGEGSTRQEHQMVFNIRQPKT